MVRAPEDWPGAPPESDPVMDALHAAVANAKGSDPLAPATVVAPSAYAALAARRTLGACAGPQGRRGIANVSFTTVDKLIRQLGLPVLASRHLRPAPHPVDLEAIRTGALSSRGWLAELVGHPRGLLALRDAVTELRRCPAPTLAAMGRRLGRIGDLVRLLDAVRSHLHERGFAESVDLVEAAIAAVTGSAGVLDTLGPVLCFGSAAMAPSERRVLDLVAARTGTRSITTDRSDCALTEVRACADPDEEVRAATPASWHRSTPGPRPGRRPCSIPPVRDTPGPCAQELTAAGVAVNGPETKGLRPVWWRGRAWSACSSWPVRTGGANKSCRGCRAPRSWPAPTVDACPPADGTRSRPRRGWSAAAQWGERLSNLASTHPPIRATEASIGATGRRTHVDRHDRTGRLMVDPCVVGRGSARPLPRRHRASWPDDELAAVEQVRAAVHVGRTRCSVGPHRPRFIWARP